MVTCLEKYSPRQVSVNPPDEMAIFPCFSSPAERIAEVGSRSIALHKFPNASTYLVACGLTVGYTFPEMTKGEFKRLRGERFVSTYLVDLVHEFGLFLWCQFPDVVQQLPVDDETGSLLSRMIWRQVTVRESQDCGLSPGQIATRSRRSPTRGKHGEKFSSRNGEPVLIYSPSSWS